MELFYLLCFCNKDNAFDDLHLELNYRLKYFDLKSLQYYLSIFEHQLPMKECDSKL